MVSAVSRIDFCSLPQDIISTITSELSKINPINFKENTGLAALYTSNRQISGYVYSQINHLTLLDLNADKVSQDKLIAILKKAPINLQVQALYKVKELINSERIETKSLIAVSQSNIPDLNAISSNLLCNRIGKHHLKYKELIACLDSKSNLVAEMAAKNLKDKIRLGSISNYLLIILSLKSSHGLASLAQEVLGRRVALGEVPLCQLLELTQNKNSSIYEQILERISKYNLSDESSAILIPGLHSQDLETRNEIKTVIISRLQQKQISVEELVELVQVSDPQVQKLSLAYCQNNLKSFYFHNLKALLKVSPCSVAHSIVPLLQEKFSSDNRSIVDLIDIIHYFPASFIDEFSIKMNGYIQHDKIHMYFLKRLTHSKINFLKEISIKKIDSKFKDLTLKCSDWYGIASRAKGFIVDIAVAKLVECFNEDLLNSEDILQMMSITHPKIVELIRPKIHQAILDDDYDFQDLLNLATCDSPYLVDAASQKLREKIEAGDFLSYELIKIAGIQHCPAQQKAIDTLISMIESGQLRKGYFSEALTIASDAIELAIEYA